MANKKKDAKKNASKLILMISFVLVLIAIIGGILFTVLKKTYGGIYGLRFKQTRSGTLGHNEDYSIYALLKGGKEKLVFDSYFNEINKLKKMENENELTSGYNIIGHEFIDNILYIYYGKRNKVNKGDLTFVNEFTSILVFSVDFNEDEISMKKEHEIDEVNLSLVKVVQDDNYIYYAGYESTDRFNNMIYSYNKKTKTKELVYDYSENTNISSMLVNNDKLFIYDIGNSNIPASVNCIDLNEKKLSRLFDNVLRFEYDMVSKNIVLISRKQDSYVLSLYDTSNLSTKEIADNAYGLSVNNNIFWITENDNLLHIDSKKDYTIDLKKYVPENIYSIVLKVIDKDEIMLEVNLDSTGKKKYYKVNIENGKISELDSVKKYTDGFVLINQLKD